MLLNILITLMLVFLNGFFVAAEFAIVKIRGSQLELKAKRGNKKALLAKHIVNHLDSYLAATQLGITLASLGLGWLGEPVVSKLIISIFSGLGLRISEVMAHNIALPVAFAIITVLHIVFGELAPKSIAIQRSEKTTLAIAYPLQFFYFIFKPFIWLLNGIANFLLKLIGITPVHGSEVHSSEEMKYLVSQSKDSGTMKKSEYDLIVSAFDFSDRTVRQILIPRIKVSAIDIDDFYEKQLEKVIAEGYSRYPVYKGTLDEVVGIVYTKDVLLNLRKQQTVPLKDILRKSLFVPESIHIGTLLKDFQRKRQQMAIVVDEYGNTQGIVTMEDILEELVGEIQDEYDDESLLIQKKDETSFIVHAQTSLLTINQRLPKPIDMSTDYSTLAGAIIEVLKRIPEVNEKLILGDYEVTILRKDGNTLVLAQLRELEEDEQEA